MSLGSIESRSNIIMPSRAACQATRENPCGSSSNCVPLEAPIVTFRFFQHLPKGTLPFARLLIFFFDPECHLHHATRNVPITPQGLHGFVVVTRPRRFVKKRAPSIFVFANKFNLLEGVLRLPFLNLLPDFTHRRLGCARDSEHTKRCQDLHFGHMVLVPFGNLC